MSRQPHNLPIVPIRSGLSALIWTAAQTEPCGTPPRQLPDPSTRERKGRAAESFGEELSLDQSKSTESRLMRQAFTPFTAAVVSPVLAGRSTI